MAIRISAAFLFRFFKTGYAFNMARLFNNKPPNAFPFAVRGYIFTVNPLPKYQNFPYMNGLAPVYASIIARPAIISKIAIFQILDSSSIG